MMWLLLSFICVFFICGNVYGYNEYQWGETDLQNYRFPSDLPECQGPMTAEEWILSQRGPDYGWGRETPRAIIALSLNYFEQLRTDDHELLLMKRQLDVEVSQALLRNLTSPIPLSDLSLYVNALLAVCGEPRDFYGVDLVDALYWRTLSDRSDPAVALSVLAVCNANAATDVHFQSAYSILNSQSATKLKKENAILSLMALMCIMDTNNNYNHYSRVRDQFVQELAEDQERDGSFGNIYTTALAVQVLTVANFNGKWDEYRALEFLKSYNTNKSYSPWTMLSAYYVILAQNARKVRFLKDLACHKRVWPSEGPFPSLAELKKWPRSHYVRYILRLEEISPANVEIAISMMVPSNATFFDIMRLAADEDSKFNFSWHLKSERNLVVYSIAGIPNDAEEGMYWHLYEQKRAVGKECPVGSILEEYIDSPISLIPEESSNIIYWLHDAFTRKQ